MNIQVQCCGLAMIILLVYFSFRQKTVGLYTEKIFTRVLYITMISVTLDIISIVAITYSDALPARLTEVICKSYIISLVGVGFGALSYVLTDMYPERTYYKKLKKFIILGCIEAIVISIAPIYSYHEGNIIYTYGASVLLTYASAVLYVLFSMYYIVRYRKRLNKKRRQAALIWMAVWLIAATIQFMNNSLLLVGFACSMGMVVLFLSLENPEVNIDRQIGCFNSHALSEYLKQIYYRQEQATIMVVCFAKIQKRSEDRRSVDRLIKETVSILAQQDVKVFKNVEPELWIVFPQGSEHLIDVIQDSVQRLIRKNDVIAPQGPIYMLMENCQLVRSADEVLQAFRYMRNVENGSEDKCVLVTQESIVNMQMKEKIQRCVLEAMEEDRVEVFYQPIYGTKEKRFVSAEALVRIRKKDGSILMPNAFIEVAEETGLIVKLGELIFEKTCDFLNRCDIRSLGMKYIEINLSVVQCEWKQLASSYIEIMKRYQVDPTAINLEVTETASIQTRKILMDNMQKLIQCGVCFSLDDFGNGQSNLDYLIQMPVSVLKLDRNMIQSYFREKKAKFVVDATVNMVHEMNVKVVAEGVETKEQLDEMEHIGVDFIQGYYFSKPLPEEQFLEFITEKGMGKDE